jgi:transforming growth factor-beta-induced protein
MKTIRILSVAAIAAAVTITPSLFAGESCSVKNVSASACTANNDIVAVASSAGSFSTLVAAVKAVGLVEILQGTGQFTVFAPTDEAFAKLPKGAVEDLLKPENKEKLAAILTYHVVPGKVMAADVKTMEVATVNGKELDVKVADGVVTVNNAKVIKTDVAACNGVIRVIDTVLLPN